MIIIQESLSTTTATTGPLQKESKQGGRGFGISMGNKEIPGVN